MNYVLTPSLTHLALVKIAATLWNQDDVWTLISEFCLPLVDSKEENELFFILENKKKDRWQKVVDRVVEKVPQLPQPEPLKREILCFIKPIGLQILIWLECFPNYHLVEYLRNNLSWTPQGTVDKKKTAEALIKIEDLDITRRYQLACLYCLEDYIPGLWNKTPENRREYYYNEEEQDFLVVLWTYDIKGEVAKMNKMDEMIRTCIRRDISSISPYQYAFEHAVFYDNKAASEYFWQKLTSKEKEETLLRSAGPVISVVINPWELIGRKRTGNVLFFLLSQMDKEQQIEVFKSRPYEMLNSLLDWPWQGFFMETANGMWDFLSNDHSYWLLEIIIDKVIDGYKDYNYQKLFGEFWKQSPNAHKRCAIDRCSRGTLLSNLLKIGHKENVRLILKEATLKEKERIIFSLAGKDICKSLIFNDKWDLLKFFIQECISSKDIMVKFKEEFKESIISRHSVEKLEKEKDMRNKTFQLLDDLIHKDDKKRSMEEGDSSPAKRLHSTEFEEVKRNLKK